MFRNGCYSDSGELYRPSSGSFYVCSVDGKGFNTCPPPADGGIGGGAGSALSSGNFTSCRTAEPNFYSGAVSFDNIFQSFLAVFQVVLGWRAC